MVNGAPIPKTTTRCARCIRMSCSVTANARARLQRRDPRRPSLLVTAHDWSLPAQQRHARRTRYAAPDCCRHRLPHVFAATSQVFFMDPERRRGEPRLGPTSAIHAQEETVDICIQAREPENSPFARGNL